MTTKNITAICLFLITIGCGQADKTNNPEDLKQELKTVEQSFSDASAQKGFYQAMLDFAADDILKFNSGDTVLHDINFIKGIVKKYPEGTKPPYTITWKAEKIDVAASGDLGYTYGWYKMVSTDSLGNEQVQKGLYKSVWKKINGVWKLVMD